MSTRAPFDGRVRRKPLSVVIREVRDPPEVGERVAVDLGNGDKVLGRVSRRLGWSIIRVELEVES